jgi:hypothetical protein
MRNICQKPNKNNNYNFNKWSYVVRTLWNNRNKSCVFFYFWNWSRKQFVEYLVPLKFPLTIFQISSTTQNLWDFPYTTVTSQLLGVNTKLRKAMTGFNILIYLSIRMEKIGYHWTGFYETLCLVLNNMSIKLVLLKSNNVMRRFTSWR